MSLLKLSILKDCIYAPDVDGSFVHEAYNKRRFLGQMEKLAFPQIAGARSNFKHYLDRQIEEVAWALPKKQPLVVMVHGFLFDPRDSVSEDPTKSNNPHSRVFHFSATEPAIEQREHSSSWPLHLGFEEEDGGKHGLAVGFGWQSSPGFATSLIKHFKNFYARAYEMAGETAGVLASTLVTLHELFPSHPIHIFCHSLGSRVVIRALAMLAKRTDSDLPPAQQKLFDATIRKLGQVIILGGAEYVVEAQLLQRRLLQVQHNLAGADGERVIPQIFNVVSRENDVLDLLGENFGPRTFGVSQVVGHDGLSLERPRESLNWMDLQIDSAGLQDWMRKHHRIEISGDREGNVWDHWYYYTFRGNMELYRGILREPDKWSQAALRRKVGRREPIPEGVQFPRARAGGGIFEH